MNCPISSISFLKIIKTGSLHNLLLLALFLLFNSNSSYAQEVTAKASIDTNNVLIGYQIRLQLEVHGDKNLKVTFPEVADSIGKVEFIKAGKIDTILSGSDRLMKRTYMITSFDSGAYTLPPFVFMYEKPGFTTMFPVSTDSVRVMFTTMAVDTNQAIKDIKKPLEEPFTIWDFLNSIKNYIWLAILIDFIIKLAAVAQAYFYYRRRQLRKKMVLGYDPSVPAHIAALKALQLLEGDKLWQKGQLKQYHSRLTEIVRAYIERRFVILALEMISSEITDAISPVLHDKNIFNKLKHLLELADMVKFAKFEPLPDENAVSMTYAIDFVNATIPVETKEEAVREEKN
jgi:hypothetical protein